MRKSTRIALAFMGFASMATVAAAQTATEGQNAAPTPPAAENAQPGAGAPQGGPGGPRGMARMDTNNDGSVTLEEFTAAFGERWSTSDANNDGELSVAEIADGLERRVLERRAQRMIERFDYDGDGKLTVAEIEDRRKKMFALADANNDGKLDQNEMRRAHGAMMGMRGESDDDRGERGWRGRDRGGHHHEGRGRHGDRRWGGGDGDRDMGWRERMQRRLFDEDNT